VQVAVDEAGDCAGQIAGRVSKDKTPTTKRAENMRNLWGKSVAPKWAEGKRIWNIVFLDGRDRSDPRSLLVFGDVLR